MYIGTLEPASNQADFIRTFEVIDDETDEAIDLSAATIVFEIRDQKSQAILLSATNSDGVTINDTGVFTVEFTKADMQTLDALTYDIGCTIMRTETEQFIIATISILDGVTQ
jgi:hypothetical protein